MEETVKKRLVGAIVLVALAVIFVPFLLEEKEKLPQSESVVELQEEIPVQPNRKFRSGLVPDEKTATQDALKQKPAEDAFTISERLDLGEYQPPPAASNRPTSASTSTQQQRKPAAEAENPSDSNERSKPDTKVTAPAEMQKPSTPKKGWIIQAGSFGNKANADKLQKSLGKKSMNAYIEEIKVKEKTLYRVRIGPFSDKQKAAQALDEVEKAFNLKGRVIKLK